MSRSWHLLPILAVLSCGGAQTGSRSAASTAGVERFFPLANDTIFTYQTVSDHGPEMFMVRVRRLGPETAQLLTGSSVRVLSIKPDSIHRAGGGFVLQAPLVKGTSWQGDRGTVRVVDDNHQLTVPAGSFKGCVQTVEEIGGDARGRVTTWYCPEVGIARMVVEEWRGADQAAQIVELKAFGPPTDLR